MDGIKFETLVGLHELSGVSFEQFYDEDRYDDAQVCNFILDGVTYSAVEDPDDGWRSSLRHLIVSSNPLMNTFAPVTVLVTIRDVDDTYILDLIDAVTGKVVLSVGTDSSVSYYPTFIADWRPQNLIHNKNVVGGYSP